MGLAPALVSLLLATAPASAEKAQFLFLLHGVAVGRVELTFDAKTRRFTYASEHAFPKGAASRSKRWHKTWTLEEGQPTPEALWLWRKPALGCSAGVEE